MPPGFPYRHLTVEVNAELIRDDLVRDRELQYLAGELEWDVLGFLALRGGIYQNIAESDADATITGGVGLDLALLRFDIAGAYGLDTVEYDGEYPTNARISFALSIDWWFPSARHGDGAGAVIIDLAEARAGRLGFRRLGRSFAAR